MGVRQAAAAVVRGAQVPERAVEPAAGLDLELCGQHRVLCRGYRRQGHAKPVVLEVAVRKRCVPCCSRSYSHALLDRVSGHDFRASRVRVAMCACSRACASYCILGRQPTRLGQLRLLKTQLMSGLVCVLNCVRLHARAHACAGDHDLSRSLHRWQPEERAARESEVSCLSCSASRSRGRGPGTGADDSREVTAAPIT